MGFCPRCGHPAQAGATACVSCGAPLAPARLPAAPPPDGARPVGRTQEPWLVPVLILVTIGVYTVVYWWRVSKEADAFQGTPGRAHHPVRVSVYVSLAALALLVAGMTLAGVALTDALATGNPDAVAEAVLLQAGVGVLLSLGGVVTALIGAVFMYVGAWRVWRMAEDDERRRGVPSPLSPALMLVLLLVPLVSIVTAWVAYWLTQRSLNGVWDAAARAAGARSVQA